MATYTRNIQGYSVELTLIEVNPNDVTLIPRTRASGFRCANSARRKETKLHAHFC